MTADEPDEQEEKEEKDEHHPAVFEAKDVTPEPYDGRDRRRAHRRNPEDRREAMRLELDNPDRSDGGGRRKEDRKPRPW